MSHPAIDRFKTTADETKHTPAFIIFEFGKFCSMRGYPPPTRDEYREVLEMEGFSVEEIDAAVAKL